MLAHWDEVETRLIGARAVCVLADFDGTLSPIVDIPDKAELPAAARRVLKSLASRSRVIVGIVSGRSLADIRSRVGLSGVWYVGNHGFEICRPTGEEERFYDDEDLASLRKVREEMEREVSTFEGTLLEHKGPILTLHTRNVSEELFPRVEKSFLSVIRRHHRQVRVAHGIDVLEARLRGSCNKGTALRHIRRTLPVGTLILYFGDDLTDRDAFRMLQGIGLSIQVGDREDSLADYMLPDTASVVEALGRIEDHVRVEKTTRRRNR